MPVGWYWNAKNECFTVFTTKAIIYFSSLAFSVYFQLDFKSRTWFFIFVGLFKSVSSSEFKVSILCIETDYVMTFKQITIDDNNLLFILGIVLSNNNFACFLWIYFQ